MSKRKRPKLPKNIRLRDGKYTYRYRVPSVVIIDGIEQRASKQMESPRFDSAQQAEDFGVLIRARKLQKTLSYEQRITVSLWAIEWLNQYILEREPSENTILVRKVSLKHITEEFGGYYLSEVTPSAYQKFLFKKKEQNLSKSTITLIHNTAQLMFKMAKRLQHLTIDPTDDAVVPREKQAARKPGEKRTAIPKFLEKDELKVFLQVSRFSLSTNNWALYLVMAYTGLRISEAAGLQWDDVNMKHRTIDVNKQIIGTNVLKYRFGITKNEQSERIISFGDTVFKALEALREWQKREKLSAKKFNPNDNFVFWSSAHPGYPISICSISHSMHDTLRKAGLPDNLTPHSLRHTHVSLLASNPKVSLQEIQARIGHKENSKVTAAIYLHVTKNRQMGIADDFEWAMNN